jgi:hypothetical protein
MCTEREKYIEVFVRKSTDMTALKKDNAKIHITGTDGMG